MIYGVLGLSQPPNLPSHLAPDYRQSFPEVYHIYARFLIEYTKDLTLLCAKRSSPIATLPTWVPDFRNLKRVAKIPHTVAKASFSADQREMTLEGVMYGRCVSVTAPLSNRSNIDDESLYRLYETFDKNILQLASSIQQRHPKGSINAMDQLCIESVRHIQQRGNAQHSRLLSI